MNDSISNVAAGSEALGESVANTADQAIRSTQRAAGEKLSQLAGAVDEARAQAGPAINRIANDVAELRTRGIDFGREASAQMREAAVRATNRSVAFIRDEPVKAVLVAAALGAVSVALFNTIGRAGSARE